jgi:GNAT superfamily N-acetyltransferase
VAIRPRRPDDLVALANVLDRVSEASAYPPHRPAPSERLIATRDELASLAYQDDAGLVLGHVALHESSAPAVMDVATDATGLPLHQLAVVARLFVDPAAQGRGIGAALLARATRRSHELGRRPVLDVWEGLASARAFYEAAGWKRLGDATIEFRSGCTTACVHDGRAIRSLVYAGADAHDSSPVNGGGSRSGASAPTSTEA